MKIRIAENGCTSRSILNAVYIKENGGGAGIRTLDTSHPV